MLSPVSDDELHTRQARLQAEAATLLSHPRWLATFADLGQPLVTGSYVSALMCWREIDVMLLGGPEFSPDDMLDLLRRVVAFPGVVGFDYHDERGPRSPTGEVRDERYHATITLDAVPAAPTPAAIPAPIPTAIPAPPTSALPTGPWRIDLSVWLHDDHANVTAWHEALRDSITDEQRRAVLSIKDVWHRLPSYPDEVGGLDVYTAVVEHGIRTPQEFGAWLAAVRPT